MSLESMDYPEKIEITAGGRARGELRPPSSKSLTQRYFALALLAGKALEIRRPLISEDTELFMGALEACGWRVRRRGRALNRLRGGAPENPPDTRTVVPARPHNPGAPARPRRRAPTSARRICSRT